MFKILKSFKTYEFTCKLRNHHKPHLEDEDDFLKNTQFPKTTFCDDCGFELELKLNESDSNRYWVREI